MYVKNRNSVRKLVIFFTLIAFIAANVGLAVFTHSCSISGTEKSLFVSADDPCSDEHPVQKKTCCSKEAEEEEHIENSCCSTDTDYVALNIDTRIEQSIVKIILSDFISPEMPQPVFYYTPELVLPTQQRLEYSNLPPPKYQGRDFQSIHQVYLI
jgi:hypothetical protein